MTWFVDRVLPGLIVGIPSMAVTVAGLYYNFRAGKRVTEQVTAEQTRHLTGAARGEMAAEHDPD